ncbi:glycerol 2-dehydrogenase (NADP(+)) [Hyphodiscus hymeniophilus]|uniref:Glycerol 2-dehydrogenase (NADP(+)) n=1 Tax=Hyphodiscus hymeniophilus TaxID=353542 RepID=A0A9P6VQU5_9HELO|nr:glycerol 2-dehydrogenase (NADP(+)) [Hyphodiscus hymeniophilus]
MSLPKTFPLKAADGKTIQIPSVGYGTWASGSGGWCKDAVLEALKAGYRHLDCAWMYGVDAEVGAAIKESGIPRSEIFVTSKFPPQFLAPENAELCLDTVLKDTGLDYIDLYLIHWPCAFTPKSKEALINAKAKAGDGNDGTMEKDGKPVIDWEHTSRNLAEQAGQQGSLIPTWNAMKALVKKGKTRTIGVSNFSIADIKDLLPEAKDIPISCNQIEVHPWLPQTELIAFGKEHGILTTCYSPFAGQKEDGETLLKDETILKLAKKNHMDIGQMLQSWAVQRGTVPLGKSATPARIRSNLDIRKLSDEDMKAIDGTAKPGDEGRTGMSISS